MTIKETYFTVLAGCLGEGLMLLDTGKPIEEWQVKARKLYQRALAIGLAEAQKLVLESYRLRMSQNTGDDGKPLLVGGAPDGLAHLLVGSAAACGIGQRLDVRWVPLMSAQPWEMCCECQAKANKRGMIPQSVQNP